MIVDTHVHVVSDDRQSYPMRDDAPDWPVTTAESLVAEMDTLGVSHAMLVQTFFTYGTDNSYAIHAAARYPSRFQTVCVIDQARADAPDILTDLVHNHGVRGLRLMPKGHKPGILWDPATFPLWRSAGELGIPVTVAAEIEHIPHMPAVVERFPEVRICFEHMWALDVGQPPFERIKSIFDLARFPNVSLKLAPNNSFAAREAGIPPKAFFQTLVEHFGIGRMMWGSNYPAHCRKFGNLADRLRIMQDDFSFLGSDDRERFFGANALALWPFPDKRLPT